MLTILDNSIKTNRLTRKNEYYGNIYIIHSLLDITNILVILF